MTRLGRVLLLSALIAGCEGSATEIVLVVDTDRADATGLRVDATYPSGGVGTATADLAERPAPRRLVLVHESGPLGPVGLRIAALDDGGALVEVAREVTFEEGRSLTLRVFLAGTCAGCPGGLTCGDDGSCRDPSVAACEYEGRTCAMDGSAPDVDGGAPDAAPGDAATPVDAGSCPTLCGVGGTYLPGDRANPGPCEPAPGFEVEVTDPGGAPVGSSGPTASFLLARPGSYAVSLSDPDGRCAPVSGALIAGAADRPPSPHPGSDEVRDLDARVGTAFVASQGGAHAADRAGWYDLRAPSVASGDVADADLRAVALADGIAYFGPESDRDEITRVETVAPFDAAVHSSIGIGGGNRRVFAMAARADARGPVALATGRVTVVQRPDSAPVVRDLAPDYEPTDWIAIGALEHATVGAVWAGRADEIVNRALGSGGAFGGGDILPRPAAIGDLQTAAVYDADGAIDLWLCGNAGVQRVRVDDVDWSAATELPAPAASAPVACADLALGADGSIWVAAGTRGLLRLDADGSQLATVEAGAGLPTETSVDFVATASDGTGREVWILDAENRTLFVLRGDATP